MDKIAVYKMALQAHPLWEKTAVRLDISEREDPSALFLRNWLKGRLGNAYDFESNALLRHPQYRAFERGVYQGTVPDTRQVPALKEKLNLIGGNMTRFVLPDGSHGGLLLPRISTGINADGNEAFLHPVVTAGRAGTPELSTFLHPQMLGDKYIPLTRQHITTDMAGETPKTILDQIRALANDLDMKGKKYLTDRRGNPITDKRGRQRALPLTPEAYQKYFEFFAKKMIQAENRVKGKGVALPDFAVARKLTRQMI